MLSDVMFLLQLKAIKLIPTVHMCRAQKQLFIFSFFKQSHELVFLVRAKKFVTQKHLIPAL